MASTFFGVNAGTVPPGSPVEIGIFVNTEGVSANAISGDVVIPPNEGASLLNGGSLVSLWLVPPMIVGDRIHFEGVIPGGITSSQLPLFSVVLIPEHAGDALSLTTENVRVYKNDGLGTELPVTNGKISLTVKEGIAAAPERTQDVTPPEPFTPILVSDPSIASGRTALVFAAVDNDSGVDYYQVSEMNGFGSSSWVTTTSPYVLHSSLWPKSSVAVRAVDRAGNIRIELTSRPASTASVIFSGGCILLVVIVAILFLAMYRRGVWRKQKNSRRR